ncbi:MAG: hypothetical protein KAI47_22505 [Deltaproteobacteria bacterium]|nr:hypothetical protein [Deltaproteobacteria bacterium]
MPRLFRVIVVSGVLVVAGTMGLESVATAAPGTSLSRAQQVARGRLFRTNQGYRRSTLPLYRRDRLRRTHTRVLRRRSVMGQVRARRSGNSARRSFLSRRLRYHDNRISAANIGHGATVRRVALTDGETLGHLRRSRVRHRAGRSLHRRPLTSLHRRGEVAPRRAVTRGRRVSPKASKASKAPKWKAWKR